MSTLFHQITICGVGLIGGSLALVAREQGLIERAVGLGRTLTNLEVARNRGMIDLATQDPIEAARGADLVMLAVPIRTMPALLRTMIPHLPPNAVITDVGSVKGWVVRELEPLLKPGMSLVAVHPVAGKETTGADAADRELFVNRRVIITPSKSSTPDAIDRVEQLWRATGANVERMDPDAHDRILARSSHLPQLVASALAASLKDEHIAGRLAIEYGAGGLRDTTRLAASSAEMWRDIVITNREAIVEALKAFGATFAEFLEMVEAGDEGKFNALFERGRAMRAQLK
ncbi:MAG TPA: prephenate dehydrogenase/arogenate dehydrogenase family protein [Candidatus Binataceae bacterium]|nr:prephenate dehydrogenase/arogenate dehydrogenase family protein [Candidatus Binataceae bacterium]